MSKISSGLARSGFRGYVTHSEFGGYRIPVPVQNLILRDYAGRKNLLFKLSIDEYFFQNCCLQMDNLLGQLSTLEGIIMCSLFILPGNEERRLQIYDKFLKGRAELHMVFESIVLKGPEDVEYAEVIFKLNEVLRNCPRSIPEELLPSLNGLDSFSCEARRALAFEAGVDASETISSSAAQH